jgi:transglutaminase-like putative cysteine protease
MGSRPRAAPAAAPVVNLTRAPPFDYANAPQGSTCLFCRDFSGPDCVAAQYPLSSLPHDDPVGYLAAVLCGPFESATDKARAIFTWCHHNIVYDVDGFFSGCIPRGQTTSQQIFSGKAVCEGYANIYMEIAKHAGLEVVKITGHGKGYGYKTFHPGDPLPEITGHAWNAVQIDGAQWKLLDSCWGAGAVEPGRYIKRFEPSEFTAANEVFGLRHYPSDGRSFYRADGATPDWEDYLVGPTPGLELPAFYSHCLEEGFDKTSLEPVVRLVDPATAAQDGYVRFLASHICEHWDGAKHGKGPMYPIILNIKDAQNKTDLRPMETDGFWYWIDVPVHELPRGGEVFLSIVTSINNEDVRGKGNDYFAKMKGRSAMSWAHIASWNLA